VRPWPEESETGIGGNDTGRCPDDLRSRKTEFGEGLLELSEFDCSNVVYLVAEEKKAAHQRGSPLAAERVWAASIVEFSAVQPAIDNRSDLRTRAEIL